MKICQNKYLTYQVLGEYMPVSIQVSPDNFLDVDYLMEEVGLKFPVVVKPLYRVYGEVY